MTKRLIVKKEGEKSEDFKNLSKVINELIKETKIEVIYISVATFPDKQELLVKGELSAITTFINRLEVSGLLIGEEMLIPL